MIKNWIVDRSTARDFTVNVMLFVSFQINVFYVIYSGTRLIQEHVNEHVIQTNADLYLQWHTYPKTFFIRSLLYSTTPTPTTTTTQTQLQCPTDDPQYVLMEGRCAYIEETRLTYDQAIDNCKEKMKDYGGGILYEPSTLHMYYLQRQRHR